MAGAAATAVRRSRKGLPPSASAPALPSAASPVKPPTPPPLFGQRPRRTSFGVNEQPDEGAKLSPMPSPVSKPRDSPAGKSKDSPMASPAGTPRTPRSVEVSVESQELAVPGGAWASDGCLELAASGNVCTIIVKTGLTGRGGLNVVLRVGLALQGVADNCLRIPATADALSTWTTVHVAGVEECDMGRLPSRPGSLPKAPQPGSCRHEWNDAGAHGAGVLRCGELSANEALAVGPNGASCSEFYCGLSLEVGASCAITPDGQAKLRVEVRGELRLLTRFFCAGRDGVASLYKAARDLYRAGDDAKALQSCEEAATIADVLVPRPREMGDVLNLMGALHLRRRNPTIAVKCLERALLLRKQMAGGAEDLGMAATLSTLGNAHQALSGHAEARRCYEHACSILKSVSGDCDPAVASCLQSLGGVHRALGSLCDAKHCLEEALSIRDKLLGADDPLTAGTLNNLGAVLQGLSDDRGAIRCYQRALQIQMKVHGRSHPMVAATLSNLGSAHARLSEPQCAVDCHQRALNIQETHLGPEDVGVASSLHNLGNALALAGSGGDAARCLWRALDIWCKALGPKCDAAATLHSLGNVYRGMGDTAAASQCFAGALRIREALLGATHQETARTRHCAALVGCKLGEESKSLQELDVAASSLLSTLGAKHPWAMQARADAESLRQVVAA